MRAATLVAMTESMDPIQTELERHDCWFPSTDRVARRPDVTAFKQTARLQQSKWREAQGYPKGQSQGGGRLSDNGSRLAPVEPLGGDFRNFLSSPAIRAAVTHRSSSEAKAAERGQQFNETRLRQDLLSSMPMCFNLFGELHGDPERLTRFGKELGLDRPGLEVKFEHSPGRRVLEFTNDGTAFDVALFFGEPDGPRTVVGIETKYHEHALKESVPDSFSRTPRYAEISERAVADGILKPGWQGLLNTELQQIWRDHLLVLSMLQHPSGLWDEGLYVLVHPQGNPSFAEAGARYRDEFLADDSTFAVKAVEELLDYGVLHSPDVEREFRNRYLW